MEVSRLPEDFADGVIVIDLRRLHCAEYRGCADPRHKTLRLNISSPSQEVAVYLRTHVCEIGDAAKVSRDGTNNQSRPKDVAGT